MKKNFLLQLSAGWMVFLAVFFLNIPLAHSQSPSDPNKMLIKFNPGTSETYITSYKNSLGAIEVAMTPVSKIRLWYISSFSDAYMNYGWTNINETVNGSKNKPGVNTVGLDFATAIPYVNGNGTQTWEPTGNCSNFEIYCTTASRPVKVAILDTGIGYTGTSADPTFCNEALFNPFYTTNIGYDFVNNDSEPKDDIGHGTHITGVIAKMASSATSANIQLLSYKTHDATGVGSIFDIVEAVDRAITDGAKIINMSFSYEAYPPSDKPEPLETAINTAGTYGILVVASAGNLDDSIPAGPNTTCPMLYPASFTCPNIVSVASVDCDGVLSDFSSWGVENIDVAMLGEDVVGPHYVTGNPILKSGTSQATAIVTGIATQLATWMGYFNYAPVKCAILNGANYKQSLEDLILTEGIANAPDALDIMLASCLQNPGYGYSLAAAPVEIQDQLMEDQIAVYPNPFNDQVEVIFNDGQAGETVTFHVYNAIGSLVYSDKKILEESGAASFTWQPNQSALSGIYFVRIQSAGKIFTQKVIKQ